MVDYHIILENNLSWWKSIYIAFTFFALLKVRYFARDNSVFIDLLKFDSSTASVSFFHGGKILADKYFMTM